MSRRMPLKIKFEHLRHTIMPNVKTLVRVVSGDVADHIENALPNRRENQEIFTAAVIFNRIEIYGE